MAKQCRDYVGLTCVNGSCPIAMAEEYEEYGMPVVKSCIDCFYYKGCEDCALCGTEYCNGQQNLANKSQVFFEENKNILSGKKG